MYNAGLGAGVPYASWNEDSELVANSAVWLMESGASANETGFDNRSTPLTGVDLIGTQSGSVAAASGSPPNRAFDGTDDYMHWTQNASDIVANGTNTWTLLMKLGDVTEAQTQDHTIVDFRDAAPANIIEAIYLGGVSTWIVRVATVDLINAATVTPIPTSGIVHVAFWGDATYVRCGWVGAAGGSGANGQPTKYSDFPANNRRTYTGTATWANTTFSSLRYIMTRGAAFTAGKVYYLLLSDTCLIDNLS